MKKFNLFFQLSSLTTLLVAGVFTFALAQQADEQNVKRKMTIDIEVIENGEVRKITKEVDADNGESIHAILKDLDIMSDMDISGTGERLEIRVRKEIDGDQEGNIDVKVCAPGDVRAFSQKVDGPPRPMLGVFISDHDSDGQKGAVVTSIVSGSAAEKAELKENDVIIAIDAKDIASDEQLRSTILTYKVGDKVVVKYVRDGKTATKEVVLGESAAPQVVMKRFAPGMDDEFLFQGMMDEEEFKGKLKDFHIDVEVDENAPFLGVTPSEDAATGKGVLLGKVVEGSAAEKMGLKAGDRVLKLNGRSVTTFEELAKVISSQKAGDKLNVEYEREGKTVKAAGELGKRADAPRLEKRVRFMAPEHGEGSGAMAWSPKVVKEVNVVIEVKDCTEEEKKMLAEPASVNFDRELALNRIEFAPNPNNGQFNLEFELPEQKETRVLMFDQMGRKVHEEILLNFNGSYRNQIDISGQPNGVYFLIIAQQEKQFTRKIVKQ